MSYLIVKDDNERVCTSILDSYQINERGKNIVLILKAKDFSVSYELCPDKRFETSNSIREYLEKILKKVIDLGYILKVSEYLARWYVYIGYETDDERERRQFSVLKNI